MKAAVNYLYKRLWIVPCHTCLNLVRITETRALPLLGILPRVLWAFNFLWICSRICYLFNGSTKIVRFLYAPPLHVRTISDREFEFASKLSRFAQDYRK